MYLCICRALTTKDVQQVVEKNGCGSVAEVYRGLGCRPQCGKCVADIRQFVKDAVAGQASVVACAGAD